MPAIAFEHFIILVLLQTEHNELKIHASLQANGAVILKQMADCDGFIKQYVEPECVAYGYPGWAALMVLDDDEGDEEKAEENHLIVVKKGTAGGKTKDKAKVVALVVEDEEEVKEKLGEVKKNRPMVVKKVAVDGKIKKKGREVALVAEPTHHKPQATCEAPIIPEEDKEDDEDLEEEEKDFMVCSDSYYLHLINCTQPRYNCPECEYYVKNNKECWVILLTLCVVCKKWKRRCPELILVPMGTLLKSSTLDTLLMEASSSCHSDHSTNWDIKAGFRGIQAQA